MYLVDFSDPSIPFSRYLCCTSHLAYNVDTRPRTAEDGNGLPWLALRSRRNAPTAPLLLVRSLFLPNWKKTSLLKTPSRKPRSMRKLRQLQLLRKKKETLILFLFSNINIHGSMILGKKERKKLCC
jgi:hypothetical protein